MAESESEQDRDAPAVRRRPGRPPGRRPRAEGGAEETRREIVLHAARLFSRRGYASVSVDDIAAAAGVTPATLYYHFRGKGDLFAESVAATGEFVRQAIQQIVDMRHLSVTDRVRLLISAWREKAPFDDGPEQSGDEMDEYMIEDAMPHLTSAQQARVRAAFESAHDVIRGLMAEGVTSGELRPLPVEVLNFTFWHLFQPAHYPRSAGLGRREVDEHLLDILIRGIAAEAP
jgi:TetR/AcrR family transcriptional regulator